MITKAIIDNINTVKANYIETFLREHNIKRSNEEEGIDTQHWVNLLLTSGRLNVDEFENFLFSELFYGKRKQIRVYKLENCRKYSYPADWQSGVMKYAERDAENFSCILSLMPDENNPVKITALRMIKNEQEELENLKILFAHFIQVEKIPNQIENSYSYIPVEIDFHNKRMNMKAWQRQHIYWDEEKTDALFEKTIHILEKNFNIEVGNFGVKHKKVLYSMSKHLINDAYLKIPAFNEVVNLKKEIGQFSSSVIQALSLENVTVDNTGKKELNMGVMKFEEEIRNVVEGLTINDYFFEKDFSEIWDMGLDAIVARIKFNDRERVLTSLKGENTVTPIFVTKTFMTLRERMNESEMVDAIWIATDRNKGNLNLRYDSSNSKYLEIWIRYGIRFCKDDMRTALRIYDKYEQCITTEIKEKTSIAVNQ